MTNNIDWVPPKRLGQEKFKVTHAEGILERNKLRSAERMKERLLNYNDVNVQPEKKKAA